MKSPRTAAENKYTNVGKSRAEKLDAFADPKRQMTEDNNNNKRGEKKNRKTKGTTLALGIPLNKGGRGRGPVFILMQIFVYF